MAMLVHMTMMQMRPGLLHGRHQRSYRFLVPLETVRFLQLAKGRGSTFAGRYAAFAFWPWKCFPGTLLLYQKRRLRCRPDQKYQCFPGILRGLTYRPIHDARSSASRAGGTQTVAACTTAPSHLHGGLLIRIEHVLWVTGWIDLTPLANSNRLFVWNRVYLSLDTLFRLPRTGRFRNSLIFSFFSC